MRAIKIREQAGSHREEEDWHYPFCSSEPLNQLSCYTETLISILNLDVKFVIITKLGNLNTII